MSAVGDVESAGASFRMWDLSRVIRDSEELSGIFDGNNDEILEKIRESDSDDARAFLDLWDELIEEWSLGPNEWDMRSHSWTTKPELPIGMLERLLVFKKMITFHSASVKSAETREKPTEVLDLVKERQKRHMELYLQQLNRPLFSLVCGKWEKCRHPLNP